MVTIPPHDPPICDFCSEPHVVYAYAAEDCELPEFPIIGSEGGWAACAICKSLIDSDDWQGLEDRTVKTFVAQHPGMITADESRKYVKSIHLMFRTHRLKKSA